MINQFDIEVLPFVSEDCFPAPDVRPSVKLPSFISASPSAWCMQTYQQKETKIIRRNKDGIVFNVFQGNRINEKTNKPKIA